MLKNEDVTIFGDGECVRDYVFVEDVAEANFQAMEKLENDYLNIGTGKGTSVNELFTSLKKATGYDKEPVYTAPRPGDIKKSILNWDKAARVLDWKPGVEIENGLVKTVEFFREELDTAE